MIMGLLECLSPWLGWEQDASCRICLDSKEDIDTGPLISPCECKGTVKWVHLACWEEGLQWRRKCCICRAPYVLGVRLSHAVEALPSLCRMVAAIVVDDLCKARPFLTSTVNQVFSAVRHGLAAVPQKERESFASYLVFLAAGMLCVMVLELVKHLLLGLLHRLYHHPARRSLHPVVCVTALSTVVPIAHRLCGMAAEGVCVRGLKFLLSRSCAQHSCGLCDVRELIVLISIPWVVRGLPLEGAMCFLRLMWTDLRHALGRPCRSNNTITSPSTALGLLQIVGGGGMVAISLSLALFPLRRCLCCSARPVTCRVGHRLLLRVLWAGAGLCYAGGDALPILADLVCREANARLSAHQRVGGVAGCVVLLASLSDGPLTASGVEECVAVDV
mmetsp:Transcript_33032/g.95328  ORF Transcript_33032/g.95328 Transcript_33032/m.95328 type:complete len:389 (+) Transcript_33032:395-1561(+)